MKFKVGQIWETRNEKGRGMIEAIADYQADYPIRFRWLDPMPEFAASRPRKFGDESNREDLFRADGGINLMSADPKPSEWDLVRLVEPDAVPAEDGKASQAEEPIGVRLDYESAEVFDLAEGFAKIAAQCRPDLPATDIARCAFDLAEAMIAEQEKRGYKR